MEFCRGLIPFTIDAENYEVGRFSEGLAFISGNDSRFYVLDTLGNKIFDGEYSLNWSNVYNDGPCYVNGKIYVPIDIDNVIAYDKEGHKVDKITKDGFRKLMEQSDTLKRFVSFEKNISFSDDTSEGKYKAVGVKDINGKEIIPAIYDGVPGVYQGQKFSAPSGVILVQLSQYDGESWKDDEGVIQTTDNKLYYGYVDLKGNDTFSQAIKKNCKDSKEKAIKECNNNSSEDSQMEDAVEEESMEEEVVVTIGADVDNGLFSNPSGNVPMRWKGDVICSKTQRVPEGKYLVYKYVDMDYQRQSFDYVRVWVYDRNGRNGRAIEARENGNVRIGSGELYEVFIHMNGAADGHVKANFHFQQFNE